MTLDIPSLGELPLLKILQEEMMAQGGEGPAFYYPRRCNVGMSVDEIIPGISVTVKTVEKPTSNEKSFRLGQNCLAIQLLNDFSYYERSLRTSRSYLMPVGKVLFTPGDTGILQLNSSGRNRSLACWLDDSRLRELSDLNCDWHISQLEALNDVRSDKIERYFTELAYEVANPGFAHRTVKECLVRLIFSEFGRYVNKGEASQPGTRMAAWQLSRIGDFVESCGSPTISELARLVGVSERHLMRVFKNTTGETIHQYVARIRIDKAKILLMDARTPIKEICSILGFSSSSSFAAAFRKTVGVPPAAFRRETTASFRMARIT